jgi:hypothetical protein
LAIPLITPADIRIKIVKAAFFVILIIAMATFPAAALTGCSSPKFGKNTISFGPHTLTNNTWGAPKEEVLTSGIFLNEDNTFGWYWDRQDPLKMAPDDSFAKPIYPNVRIGATTSVKSNSRYFPVKLKDIKSLIFDVSYNYPTLPTGAYNLSYEIIISDKNKPDANLVPKAEVMIWLQRNLFGQPVNTYQYDISDQINTYGLYSWVMTDGHYYASFIMNGEPQFQGQYKVDAKIILDRLDLNPDWYVLGIQFGNEVVSGAGKIQIDQLVVTINGHKQ